MALQAAIAVLEIAAYAITSWRLMIPTGMGALLSLAAIILTPSPAMGLPLAILSLVLGLILGWRWQRSASK